MVVGADHGDVLAVRDGVAVGVLAEQQAVGEALALLDAAEAAVAVPLVDEAERVRLEGLAAGDDERAPHWHGLLARRDGRAVGYAGMTLPAGPGDAAVADLAVLPEGPVIAAAVQSLLAGLEALAWRYAAARLQVWIRHATVRELTPATDAGYGIERRLAVLGRRLDAPVDEARVGEEGADVGSGVRIRAYRPDEDDEAVVGVLAAAYAGTAEAGWSVADLRERRGYDWFDPADLLVAEGDDGRLRGLHWLKRRGPATGEVYNLAIAPEAQGEGLGRVLLDAGMRHLREIGCDDVLLWVDLANEPAVRLYTSRGFVTRWEDVALRRTLRGPR